MYRDATQTVCVNCENGYYQPDGGRDSCILCPAGFYCPVSMVTIVNTDLINALYRTISQCLEHVLVTLIPTVLLVAPILRSVIICLRAMRIER